MYVCVYHKSVGPPASPEWPVGIVHIYTHNTTTSIEIKRLLKTKHAELNGSPRRVERGGHQPFRNPTEDAVVRFHTSHSIVEWSAIGYSY